MAVEVGSVVCGKVTGIAKFGAFVALEEGKSGLVHISEISNGFVSDVNEYLKVGDEVRVKILGIDEKGRINLSIRQTLPPKPKTDAVRSSRPRPETSARSPRPAEISFDTTPRSSSFEDMLQHFKQTSDAKLSDLMSKEDSGRRRRAKK